MKSEELSNKFSEIYKTHRWGGASLSGPGSDLSAVQVYRRVLMKVLRDPALGIQTVLDLGCGDWEFSRTIDWGDRNYTGIDIVPHVVERLNTEFGGPLRRFVVGDLREGNLPAADLVILKDVLQHLSNTSVGAFLKSLERFRYALLTNDCERYAPRRILGIQVGKRRLGVVNEEGEDGGSRPLQLRREPFQLKASCLMRYKTDVHGWVYWKEVLLWKRKPR